MANEEIVLVCPSCDELVTEFQMGTTWDKKPIIKWRCPVHGSTSWPREEKHLINRAAERLIAVAKEVAGYVGPELTSATAELSALVADSLETAQTLEATTKYSCEKCKEEECFYCADCGIDKSLSPVGVVKSSKHMTQGSERFHQILAEMGTLHDKKQADYGTPTDPFANVRGSQDWGVPAWVGAMVRANDKIKRLQNYARKGSLSNEGARDSFMDLAVYAVIGLILWEEGHSSPTDEYRKVGKNFFKSGLT